MRKYFTDGKIPVCFVFVILVIFGMVLGIYGDNNTFYKMVNLTSPWNFMDAGWQGYSVKAKSPEEDPGDTLYPYPYWDYEKQYLLAEIRQLRKQGVNSIRILASRPWQLCENAVIKLTDVNIRNNWWSPNNGDMQFPFNTDSFRDTEYMNNHWSYEQSDVERLKNIENCWDRLFELLLAIRDNFSEPVVKVDISFTLGWSLKGKLPITKHYGDSNGGWYQTFSNYYSGTNWLYFKTFYDACKRCIDKIPNNPLSSVDELLNYLNVDFVEVGNELDSSIMRWDVNPRFLYRKPWDEDAIPEYYYATNESLPDPDPNDEAITKESTSKRSAEKLRQLIDFANTIAKGTTHPYLRINSAKVTYGFANPETMRLLTLNKGATPQGDYYIYKTLSWHMYGSLFSIGLGPTVDWVRSSMNDFSQKNYQILIGEMGHIFDYQFDDPDSQTINPAVYDAYNYYSEMGYYYMQLWLKEAKHFKQSAYENIWKPTGTICPLKGVGLWASSDIHLITDYGSSVWRCGLLETLDTPYRKRKRKHEELISNYGYPARARKFIIAPIGRYVLKAVTECWQQSPGDPFPLTWHSGDLVQHPFYISCKIPGQLDGEVNMSGYTPSYLENYEDTENMPPLCDSIQTEGGADVWFYTKYYANIYDNVTYKWEVKTDNYQGTKIVAIFTKTNDPNVPNPSWELNNDYAISTGSEATASVDVIDTSYDLDILLYLWTASDNCSPDFYLKLERYQSPNPKE